MSKQIDVVADTANGIQQVSAYDYDGDQSALTTLGYSDFYQALPSLKDGEVIHCRLSQDQYDALNGEYGIR